VTAAGNAADYLLSQGAGGDVAVVDAGQQHTYEQLNAAAGSLASELAQLDLPPGARVGVLGPNSLFWVAAYLAAIKLDLVAVPFSDKLNPADVERNARLVQLDAACIDRRVMRRFAAAFDAGTPLLTDESLVEPRAPHWPESHVDPDRDAVLMFTSGTTSRRPGHASQHPGEHRLDHRVPGTPG
jgi:acyl-CoA synthetase (AMP-forming)/AMP-acid ligase II